MTPKRNSQTHKMAEGTHKRTHKMTGQHSHQMPDQRIIDPGEHECTRAKLDAMMSLHSPPYIQANLSYLHHQIDSQLWKSKAIVAYST